MIPAGIVFHEQAGRKRYWYEVEVDAIMQFTGLTDKNGGEIYEGDIMQHDNPFNVPFVVNWDEESAGFVFNDGCTSYVINDTSFTVIGNIHQHPTLLES